LSNAGLRVQQVDDEGTLFCVSAGLRGLSLKKNIACQILPILEDNSRFGIKEPRQCAVVQCRAADYLSSGLFRPLRRKTVVRGLLAWRL
jgi:hypothetical protein